MKYFFPVFFEFAIIVLACLVIVGVTEIVLGAL